MEKDRDLLRMEKIFSGEDLARVRHAGTAGGATVYTLDLHGKTRAAARIFLKNVINVCRSSHTLQVVHGYSHGTVLLEMIRNSFTNPKVLSMSPAPGNPGMTIVQIA